MDILIVEDDAISRRLLSKAIAAMGHEVVEASNGSQAIGILEAARPIALMVTDWIMPGMDGLELCRYIRRTNFGHSIYIIVLTAKDQRSDIVEIFQAGADDYIPKPFDREELRVRLQTGMRHIELERHYQEMQRTLMESRNKLRTVFDALEEEIVSLDSSFRIVSMNKAFTDRIGAGIATVMGKMGREFLGEKIESAARRAFDTKEKSHMLLTEGSGEATRHRQVEVLPIQDNAAHVASVLVVMKDVTEARRKAEEIEALNDRLTHTAIQLESDNRKLENALQQLAATQAQMLQSEKMASIGQLAAGVAHEINNPTSFVSSNLKTLGDYTHDIFALIEKYRRCHQRLTAPELRTLLGKDVSTELDEIAAFETRIDVDYVIDDTKSLIGDCREGTERIKKIVLDLKDFAHPGHDQVKAVDINAGLESTLNVVKNEIKYKAKIHLDFGVLPLVKAFAQQLNQVFMNMLVNAAHSIAQQGEIHIRTRAVDGFVEVAIADTGCGIPEKNLSKIFDPFFTTKEVGKGTGLGLHIAYNIVQKHNGTITVQSEVGKGTTFTVRIPIKNPSLNAAVAED